LGCRGCRVDVDIHVLDAALALGVAVAGMPRPVAELNVTDFREEKAFPVAAGRQHRLAFPGKLVGQRLLLPLRAAENDGAELAMVPVISTDDLFALKHRLGKQIINGAGHREVVTNEVLI
jgi:hypothetical protein